MQPLDFSRFIDGPRIEGIMPPSTYLVENVYRTGEGAQFRSPGERGDLIQDIVRLADGVMLLASDYYPCTSPAPHSQIVSGSDWIHIQFRINGAGSERLHESEPIETPEKSCVVSRYPENSTIERRPHATSRWKAVCLLATPAGLSALLDLAPPGLPVSTRWIATSGLLEARTRIVPLQPAMVLAANDILTCKFRGTTRRAYMRAKSLELLSRVIHSLEATQQDSGRSDVKLSASDTKKLALARQLMSDDLGSTLTLAQLSERVGLNRTKFALGFKQLYGTSVQAYWRDARLTRARELLSRGEGTVTEVALEMGYSEMSSFTRAFTRKFGVLPSSCRGDSSCEHTASQLPSSGPANESVLQR